MDQYICTLLGNPCNYAMHVDIMTSRITIPRTECHDDWANIQDLFDLPGPCTEDAIIRYLRERFQRNFFQVGFSSNTWWKYPTFARLMVISTKGVDPQPDVKSY